jgi:hypothetical protein
VWVPTVHLHALAQLSVFACTIPSFEPLSVSFTAHCGSVHSQSLRVKGFALGGKDMRLRDNKTSEKPEVFIRFLLGLNLPGWV